MTPRGLDFRPVLPGADTYRLERAVAGDRGWRVTLDGEAVAERGGLLSARLAAHEHAAGEEPDDAGA